MENPMEKEDTGRRDVEDVNSCQDTIRVHMQGFCCLDTNVTDENRVHVEGAAGASAALNRNMNSEQWSTDMRSEVDQQKGSGGIANAQQVRQGQANEVGMRGRSAFMHFASDWAPLLEEMGNSHQKVSKNYGYGKFKANEPKTAIRYDQCQVTNIDAPGSSGNYRVPFMSEEEADRWVKAPEFHPAFTSMTGRLKTYAEAVDPFAPRTQSKLHTGVQFCPYYHTNMPELYLCPYLHGELCHICLNAILDIEETREKQEHLKACQREQERKIKMSLAIQKSKGINCCICLENVKEKIAGEARFGLLPNCNHCFCITCIRKWRQETRYASQITRSCPICRVESPFVCPSSFWVETPEEKEAVIRNYKNALKVKPCRLYNFGKGKCPFGEKCFYLHSLPHGKKPGAIGCQRPKRINAEGLTQFQEYVLWDFIARRDDPQNYQPSLPALYDTSGAFS